MDIENLAKELILKNMTPEQQMAVLESVRQSVANAKEVQKKKIGENVDLVVQALKKIESDIRSRFDDVGNAIEKRVASIQDGRDGSDGKDGRDGKDGKSGRDGSKGDKGDAGRDGVDGVDGVDGISVTSARIDFDGSLVITLSSGVELNVGEVVAPDLAERIKVITNGGGTSQSVLDTLASLQTQITNLIPSQTGNSGKFLTTNGTTLSWATGGGGLAYQGTWNASTNTPTLVSSTGVNGYYYITATAGSTNLDGITDWQIGDWLLFNGTVWQKIDQSNLVTSVNGQTGAVSVGTVTSVSALTLGTSGTDLSSTVANGTTTPTITLNVPTASATNRGALSSADWTTFNNKGSGTVTSVTGTSPIASSGGATPAISLEASYGDTQNPYASKTAKFVLAAPNASAGAPTFRAIVASDIPTLNQSTTGSAATLTTPRAIYGNNFDGSAALTQVIASTYGGTGNGFTKFTGATTAERTYTLPDASSTIVVQGGALGTPSSGTVTNLTGTASININGTVGATTASSGAFTTLSATGVTTVQAGTAALPAITTTGDTNTGIFFPAADTIAFTKGGVEAARIDSSGNLGIGTSSPAYKLEVRSSMAVLDGSANIGFYANGTSYTQVWQTFQSPNDLLIKTTAAKYIAFLPNSTEAMRIDSSGNLLVGATTTSNGAKFLVTQPTAAGQSAMFISSNATAGDNYGINIKYSLTSPNGTSNQFVYCQDSTQLRAEIRSNGGLANFSANNVNLSDARTKTDIQDAGSYLAKICAIPVRTFKYKDQTDDLLNLGCIAQEVETIAPELVDVSGFGITPDDGIPLKAIYQTDLQYALMKCIQEQQALITALTTRITALETK